MILKNYLRLFWWNEVKLMHKSKENYGDLIGKYLVEKISGKKVCFAHPNKFSLFNLIKPIYMTAGSILAYANLKCIVWGSGIIQKDQQVQPADFRAVRGPQTRNRLLELGYDVPEVYGDPALLLPNYYHPVVEKRYEIGIIPHYNDYKEVSAWYVNHPQIKVIDLMTLEVEQTTSEILECKQIISSSLHGLIVAHAYQIPAVWVEFSDKLFGDGIKFQDYYESVGMELINPVKIDSKEVLETYLNSNLKWKIPSVEILIIRKNQLLNSCPFIKC